jgi:energy-coupling factor transporter ATP-binding protein EcfA2
MDESQSEKLTYDFTRRLMFMEEHGKQQLGNEFKIHENDHPVIFKLLVYAIGDLENAKDLGIHLKKGIHLSGPVGCGKTSLMKLIRLFMPNSNRYSIKSCRDISFEFNTNGFKVIQKYSTQSYIFKSHSRNSITYGFDDLGSEQNLKSYGNTCNVMGEILLSRYDEFVNHGMITHITTNLSSKEIEGNYGNRVRGRMREMFNQLSFHKRTEDKRW